VALEVEEGFQRRPVSIEFEQNRIGRERRSSGIAIRFVRPWPEIRCNRNPRNGIVLVWIFWKEEIDSGCRNAVCDG
jgi:hypothetical protein